MNAPAREDPLLTVALHAPRIPQNTGQIARTCFAMNLALHLIRPLGFKIDSASLRRAGVGYWDDVSAVIHAGEEAFWNAAPTAERVYLVSKYGSLPYTDVRYRKGDWLLFGNETEGLPRQWLEAHAERTLVIPMKDPRARCLSLASAATAVIFEAVRQIELSESTSSAR